MKIFLENKSVVYLLFSTKKCILDLFTLIYERLIKTLSRLVGKHSIPVNLSDPHGRRSPAIQNEKAGDLARRLF